MKPSPLKHPLAVLRLALGFGQKEMADLIGCSTVTVQKIELLGRPLKADLARKISVQTNVDENWLIQGDPSVPIITRKKTPFTRDIFLKRQKDIERNAKPSVFAVLATAVRIVGCMLSILASAYRQKKFFDCVYLLTQELGRLEEQFGTSPTIQEVTQRVSNSARTNTALTFFPVFTAFTTELRGEARKITKCEGRNERLRNTRPS